MIGWSYGYICIVRVRSCMDCGHVFHWVASFEWSELPTQFSGWLPITHPTNQLINIQWWYSLNGSVFCLSVCLCVLLLQVVQGAYKASFAPHGTASSSTAAAHDAMMQEYTAVLAEVDRFSLKYGRRPRLLVAKMGQVRESRPFVHHNKGFIIIIIIIVMMIIFILPCQLVDRRSSSSNVCEWWWWWMD